MTAPICAHSRWVKNGHHRDGRQRDRCKICGKTRLPLSSRDSSEFNSYLDNERFWKLNDCWWDGLSIREAARICEVAKNTAAKIMGGFAEGESEILAAAAADGCPHPRTITDSSGNLWIACACGQIRGHRGWCSVRYKASAARQQFMERWHSKNRQQPLALPIVPQRFSITTYSRGGVSHSRNSMVAP